jgi:hypothetical protein
MLLMVEVAAPASRAPRGIAGALVRGLAESHGPPSVIPGPSCLSRQAFTTGLAMANAYRTADSPG